MPVAPGVLAASNLVHYREWTIVVPTDPARITIARST